MSRVYSLFTLLIIIQIFYSFSATLLTYSLKNLGINVQNVYIVNTTTYTDVGEKLQAGLQLQTNIPLVDMGALIFYSGNLLIDLMVNFFTAIPSMITALVNFYFTLFPVSAEIAMNVKLFVFSFVTILYVLMLINFLISLRTRAGILP